MDHLFSRLGQIQLYVVTVDPLPTYPAFEQNIHQFASLVSDVLRDCDYTELQWGLSKEEEEFLMSETIQGNYIRV